jgi:hypothetical protein
VISKPSAVSFAVGRRQQVDAPTVPSAVTRGSN